MFQWKQDLKAQAAILGAATLLLISAKTLAPRCLQGPYIQSPTTNSVIIRWRTSAYSPLNCAFQYRKSASSSWVSLSSAPTGDAHEITLTNLQPGTRYAYRIRTPYREIAGGEDFNSSTAPLPGDPRPVRVWILGDSGTGNARALAVRDGFRKFAGSRSADIMLMLGDNAYEKGSRFDHHRGLFLPYRDELRSAPLWPALGNHDAMSRGTIPGTYPFHQFFTLPQNGECGGMPSGSETYYSFDWGNIHFVCLDSTVALVSNQWAMLSWLKKDLEASLHQEWLIAFWHHPPYSAGSHDSDKELESCALRAVVLPELEKHGADIVLSGHNHNYGRTHLLYGHYGENSTFVPKFHEVGSPPLPGQAIYHKPRGRGDKQGTLYAVAGCSGKLENKPNDHSAIVVRLNIAGSVLLDIEDSQLDFHFLDEKGSTRDFFRVSKSTGLNSP
jgi:hypothetical protein